MINYQHPLVQEDLKFLMSSSLKWNFLCNKTVLISGATGQIASYFSFMLIYLNEQLDYNIKIILLARSQDKLKKVYGGKIKQLTFLIQDVCTPIKLETKIDFIFHAAGAASPYNIINDPVGIIKANTIGTINILELAKKTKTRKVIFTSTREVYGKVEGVNEIREHNMGIIDPLEKRSCYPESKRIAESLLRSYYTQHSVGFSSLRIAHTYGPGMNIDYDGRVMSDFLKSIISSKDIVMNSTGKAIRSFCYITDTIEAIYRVMANESDDEAYNIANESEPISIYDLALLLQKISGNNQQVFISKKTIQSEGYCKYERVKLNTKKIESLGWSPKTRLEEGLIRTLKSFIS